MVKAPWMMTAVSLSLALGLAACDGRENTPPEPTVTEAAQEKTMSQSAGEEAASADSGGAGGAGTLDESNQRSSAAEREADAGETASWDNAEDEVNEALRETERRFKEAEKELEEQFQAAEEKDVQQSQALEIQPEQ